MSMHLDPRLSTTSTKKKKQKITKSKQEELERGWKEHNQKLKQMGLPKETFEQYLDWKFGRGSKEKSSKINCDRSTHTPAASNVVRRTTSESRTTYPIHKDAQSKTTDVSYGGCTKKPAPVYTGTEMIGIATMHKSNMVPVFSDKEAKDISAMRR